MSSYSKDELEKLAELVGIILGDGHFDDNQLIFSLDNNWKEYADYVDALITNVLQVPPTTNNLGNDNVRAIGFTDLGRNNLQLKKTIENFGISKGDKTSNQVSVPSWIKENPIRMKNCIKGLFDTDGCIYYQHRKSGITYIYLNLTYVSKNLLKDFHQFCQEQNIRAHISKSKVQIQNKQGVYDFAKLVNQKNIRLVKDREFDRNRPSQNT